MAKSKCSLCGKVLKGGEWRYSKAQDGKVIKTCNDTRQCKLRQASKGE